MKLHNHALITTQGRNKAETMHAYMASKFCTPFLISVFLIIILHQPSVAHSSRPLLKQPAAAVSKFEELLQRLQGSRRGQTLEGLSQVKHFLKHYGYYTTNLDNLNDDFDESLESALKLYQTNYRLKPTGQMDAGTVSEMTIPRCGNPDIINDQGSSSAGDDHHQHESSSKFHVVGHYSFFQGRPRWSKTQLTYNFDGAALQAVPIAQLREICARAFATWARVTGFTFREAPELGTEADILIGFYRGDHGDGSSFDGIGRVAAHAFRPEIGLFHYDADENWSSNPVGNQMDLESVAVHEIGHLLGLHHSSDQNAIMFPEIRAGTTKRELGQDDINGIRALYTN